MLSYFLRLALKWLTLFVLIGGSRSQTNILFNKTVLVITKYPTYSSYFNDESDRTCLTLDTETKKMVVYDLGMAYEISKIVINNNIYRSKLPSYIYLGNEFRACSLESEIQNFKVCSAFTQDAWNTEITCAPGNNTGRFFVVLKGDVFKESSYEELSICEIRAFGNAVKDIKTVARPEIHSKPLPPITKAYFKIAPVIRKGVPQVTVPKYGNGIIYVNPNCEPIIYIPAKKLAFGVACTTSDGKGRLVAFGKYGYFVDIFTDPTMAQFKSNLQSFLSPKVKSASYVTSTDIKTMSDFNQIIKPGVIVNFVVSEDYSDEIIENLKSAIREGTVSVAFDITFWNTCSAKARSIYIQILDIFNVDYVSSYVTWSTPTVFTMDDSTYSEELIGLEERINRMSLNHDYLISQYSYISGVFTQYPPSLLKNSQIGFYLKKILSKYQDLLEWICPCEFKGMSNTNDRSLIRIMGELMKSQLLVNSNFEAPCVKLFPGDYKTPPVKNVVKINVIGVTAATKNPIGYYLEAGKTLDYNVIESNGAWTMSVGCHSDNLPDRLDGWLRYPNVYSTNIPIVGSGQVFSPFGGVLWLTNEAVNSSITLTLSNVILTPFFNLREENPAASWDNQQKNNPGLWAQIAGDSMVFCEASYRVTTLSGSYLQDLLSKIWDPIVRMEMIMTGNDWKTQRPQITVLDVMISMGYGHSGYPIEVYPGWYSGIFNTTYIQKSGTWGMCHEIGHNMQRSKWTFSGTTEVTNNIFCLFIYDKLLKLPRFGLDINNLDKNKPNIIAYLEGGSNFEKWKGDNWVALSVYAQLVNHLGWGFYKSVFEYYEKNNIGPTTDDLKMLTFMNISSIITGQNLLPIFDFWGFVFGQDLIDSVSSLPCFFPADDFFSSLSATRTNFIKEKYPNCNSKSLFFRDFEPEPHIQGNRQNFIKELERQEMS